MNAELSRRDFIKLCSLLPAVHFLPASIASAQPSQANILILVFDAWSARHISLYGYPRDTTPNLKRLAEKAVVYHNHYAGDHYTPPGTASLLTGVLPWSHFIFTPNPPASHPYGQDNLFGLFDSHHRITYTHNTVAEGVINHMLKVIDEPVPHQELYLDKDFWLSKVFKDDYDIASVGWERVAKITDDGYANSLFLSRFYDFFKTQVNQELLANYPFGLPVVGSDNTFLLEEATDWISNQAIHLQTLPTPFLGYFHLLPPHAPTNTRREFHNVFLNDGFTPPDKPEYIFSMGKTNAEIQKLRRLYDEYILFVDSEIGRLFQMLEKANALENTWVILTSDHGDMFERGIIRHKMPAFFDPLMSIPLMVFPPGQQARIDVHSPTSAVDIVPTLLHITGKQIPDWMEGDVLPPFKQASDIHRPVFAIDAIDNKAFSPLNEATLMMKKDQYKIIYNIGSKGIYEPLGGKAMVEVYDLVEDPEELSNLAKREPDVTKNLLDELLTAMQQRTKLTPK